ncbi:sigma factor [Cumulibacter soli]|uniref:sigma factor n=1 Tax=Cumulibacter soli TaxID=2546344 RepID=UPI001ABB4268|nr:sigma factor [Cumulibacter soli]
MVTEESDELHAEVLSERRYLVSLVFRMLGTVAEAEDAAQETYIRWYRLSPEERDAIEVPRAWLTRVASRVCLNVLDSARRRRERYVGPWLPEPVPAYAFAVSATAAEDPFEHATLDESVSTALLVVLEAMTPAERVSFVLHDVFAMPFDEIAEIVGRSSAACDNSLPLLGAVYSRTAVVTYRAPNMTMRSRLSLPPRVPATSPVSSPPWTRTLFCAPMAAAS